MIDIKIAILEKELKVTNIRPFLFRLSPFGCEYYLATEKSSNRNTFIKTGGILGRISHEVKAINLVKNSTLLYQHFFPEILASSQAKNGLLALEYIDGPSLEDLLLQKHSFSLPQLRHLISQMVQLVQVLQKADIVHRDVNPSNLLLKKFKERYHIILIDFAFAVTVASKRLPELQPSLTTDIIHSVLNESLTPKPQVWDDAYSFCQIVEMLATDKAIFQTDEWNLLKALQNKLVYQI